MSLIHSETPWVLRFEPLKSIQNHSNPASCLLRFLAMRQVLQSAREASKALQTLEGCDDDAGGDDKR